MGVPLKKLKIDKYLMKLWNSKLVPYILWITSPCIL